MADSGSSGLEGGTVADEKERNVIPWLAPRVKLSTDNTEYF
jgi:hypothetical protein